MANTAEGLIADLAGFQGDYTALVQREKTIAAEVKALSEQEQVAFVLLAAAELAERNKDFGGGSLLQKAASAALRKKLPFTEEQILRLVELGANPSYYFPFAGVLTLVERVALTPQLRGALETMLKADVLEYGIANPRQMRERIEAILAPQVEASATFEPQGAWSKAISEQVQGRWRELLEAGGEITGSEPSGKWLAAAGQRVEAIGRDAVRARAIEWLGLGPSPGVRDEQVSSPEADLQRGLLWSLTGFGDAEVCAAVAQFTEQSLRKIPMVGPVAQRSANAGVKVLAAMPGMEAVAQLARLALRVKYQVAQRLIYEALEEAARKAGLSREELEEITVPSFGLDERGQRVEELGDVVATLDAEGELTWKSADGAALKAVPASAKERYKEELKELRDAAKEIERMRGAHRIRLERLLLSGRAIPVERWRDCYLRHGLIGDLARRLIWQTEQGDTFLSDGDRLVSWNGMAVEPSGSLRLWHPIEADLQTVISWRAWLEDHGVRQPFKQAHREVYLLTDAERDTQVYSNRFAGHILKQHPFHALCQERGWRFTLMGQWDSHNNPYLELPAFGLRALYCVDFPRDQQSSAHGVYLYVSTDQVAFCPLDSGERLPLESVPPRVFSEVMRDVDLFVGVCSIAADPNWMQQADAPFGEYWQQQAFGELGTSGQQRLTVLQALLPKLAGKDRMRVDGRFLHVTGKRAEYKIHLGSGNVQMEPGSRYLCIVQGASAGAPGGVFLPFEGDRTLSLILSKALLLLDEDKIKDKSILRQLPGGAGS